MERTKMISKKTILVVLLSLCSITIGISQVYAASESVQLRASARANPDGRKQAAPLPVSIYLLTDNKQFLKSGYFDLEDYGDRTLGSALLMQKRYLLLPRGRKTVKVPQNSKASYLAIVAGYNSLRNKRWRRTISYDDFLRNNIVVNFTSKGISTQLTPKFVPTARGFYLESNFTLGVMSFLPKGYSYTSTNDGQLAAIQSVDEDNQIGNLGLGIGYQWKRTPNNWLDAIHIEKISLGLHVAYNPQVKIAGVETIHYKDPVKRYRFAIQSSVLEYFLTTKINVFNIDNFLPYVSLSYGNIDYDTKFTQTKVVYDFSETQSHSKTSESLFKFGFGFDYDVSNKLTFSLGYEYTPATNIALQGRDIDGNTINTNPAIGVARHDILFGLRYSF